MTDQLTRAAAAMHSSPPLSGEYEKALERHSQLYPSVRAARDEAAVADAALDEFMRSASEGDARGAADDVERARAALRAAQANYVHKQGVLPLARAIQAELGAQGSGWAMAEAGVQEQHAQKQQSVQQAAYSDSMMSNAHGGYPGFGAPPMSSLGMGGSLNLGGSTGLPPAYGQAAQQDWRQQMALSQAREAVAAATYEAAGGHENLPESAVGSHVRAPLFRRACDALGWGAGAGN